MKKIEQIDDNFPLSKVKIINGSRKSLRAKVLQVLYAYYQGEEDLDKNFNHIFFRDFNFDESEIEVKKLLKPSEVYELEADIPIKWNEEDIEFAKDLVRNSIKYKEKSTELIKLLAQNWDLERISVIDRIIINIAVAEFITCEEVPPNVTINEAIDLGKNFSTDKSNQFINGLVDAIYKKLKSENLIVKKGKGLLNF